MKLYWILIAVCMILCGCVTQGNADHPYKIKFEGEAQGTYYSATYYASDTLVSQVQIDSLLQAFDLCASIYNPRSIISRFNRNDTTVRADTLFEAIYNASMKVSERTSGAFDITVGQLVNAWGFGFKNRENMTQKVVDSLKQFTGYHKFQLQRGRLIKEDARIMIDFNAIAQGFSVDYLAAFFESKGITTYLIDIGGEVRGRGKKPGDESWVVGIEKPAADMNDAPVIKAKVHLDNLSLTTSGNYRKYYEKNGVRYSHTIDPSTGYPVQHNLLSASVVAGDCTTADAYATAFMVMGLEKTKEFLSRNQDLKLQVYCIYSDEKGVMKTWATEGFKALIFSEEP